MSSNVKSVILCGGPGTRLWLLSRKAFLKHFVPLLDNKSLLQLKLERIAKLVGPWTAEVMCVEANEHRLLMTTATQAAQVSKHAILKPTARNTAAIRAVHL